MIVLTLGDVVSESGCAFVRQRLPALKRHYGVDVCLANAENAAKGNGITPEAARHLFSSGVDLLTLGNHAFRRKEAYDFLERNEAVVRPFNFPTGAPGRGVGVLDLGRVQIGVVNLLGTVYMDPLDNPFTCVEQALRQLNGCKIVMVDFHAEATSEKRAMGFFLDGRVSAVFGTHTHVQTSDACMLPGGTGYITDLGMCGAADSVLGVKKEAVIERFRSRMPIRFDAAESDVCVLEGCLFEIDEATGHCRSAAAVRVE